MAIGKTFEEAIQKAVRMVSGGVMDGLEGSLSSQPTAEELETLLRVPTGQGPSPIPHSERASMCMYLYLCVCADKRLFAVQYALEKGYSVDSINRISHIDRWFLYRLKVGLM